METPCINVCELDRDSGHCVGCGRSGEEISRWMAMSDAERRQVMAKLDHRLERLAAKARRPAVPTGT